MDNIETAKIKVYVLINENKIIKRIESSISSSYTDFSNWVQIDEGYGDKYALAQNNYLAKGLVDEKGRYNYKYDTKLTELTEEEKSTLFPITPPEPTEIEVLKEKNATLEKALLEMAEVQSKEYENRKILENAVLDLANTIAGGE